MSSATDPSRRARRWFWALLLIAVLAMGALYAALGAASAAVTGLVVAASSLVLLAATAQATRILLALDRARRSAGTEPAPPVLPGRGAAAGAVERPRAGTMADRLLGRRAQRAGETPPAR